MSKNVCSFCGRSEKEVNLLITGLNGHICDNCVLQAYQIVQSSEQLNDKHGGTDAKPFSLKKVPKPKERKKYLDQYII